MIRAIVHQEKVPDVVTALMDAQYFAMTKFSVVGRGRQRGLHVGGVTYDELPKEMLMLVVPDTEQDLVCKIIMQAARTGAKRGVRRRQDLHHAGLRQLHHPRRRAGRGG